MIINKNIIFAISISIVQPVFAHTINGIAIKVNAVPITQFDIDQISKDLKISRDKAVQLQINKALEQSEIENLGIKADSDEVENMINFIMKNYNISSRSELFAMAQRDGISKDDFLKNIEFQVVQPQLYRQIAMQKAVKPSEDELLEEYKKNSRLYSIGDSYKIAIYSSNNANSLQQFKTNPLKQNRDIKIEQKIFKSNELSREQILMFNKLNKGEFSEITKLGNQFAILQLKEIKNLHVSKFDDIKDRIFEDLTMAKQKEAVERYFQKAKAEATIEYLR